MLVIRLQRTGKTHVAQYRVVVQDSRRTPSSGKAVAQLGSYDPHSKVAKIDVAAAEKFMENGAQPSSRVAKILVENGAKLPGFVVKFVGEGKKKTRNSEKLRKNRAKTETEKVTEVAKDEPAE